MTNPPLPKTAVRQVVTTHQNEKQVFRTDPAAAASERWSAWRRHMAEVYYRLDIVARDNEVFDGALAKRSIADLEVSGFRAGSQRVIRSNELARGDSEDKYVFVSPSRGRFDYRQNDREGSAGAGDAYILRTSAYYEVDIAEDSAMVALVIPARIAEARISGIRDLCAKAAFADPMLVATLNAFLKNIVDIDTDVRDAYMQDTLLNMLDVAVASKNSPRGAWRYADAAASFSLALLREWIAAHLADPRIDVSLAATSCGMSVRSLQQVLQNKGTTFGRMLMEARLEKAAALLRTFHQPPLQIGHIATMCGFTSQSHFATRFKQRFGVAPRDLR